MMVHGGDGVSMVRQAVEAQAGGVVQPDVSTVIDEVAIVLKVGRQQATVEVPATRLVCTSEKVEQALVLAMAQLSSIVECDKQRDTHGLLPEDARDVGPMVAVHAAIHDAGGWL